MKKNENSANLLSTLTNIGQKVDSFPFDPERYGLESRMEITKLFLKWYFGLIAGSFIFCAFYNAGAAWINSALMLSSNPLKYLEISSVVSLITSSLSSGLGFVIGYYFKSKEDK